MTRTPIPFLSLLTLPFVVLAWPPAWAAPTRAAFAEEDRPIEGVPVEAFALGDTNLQIEVWARSPMIYSPVAMDVDAKGRLWCTEGLDYNKRGQVPGPSIIVLEDTDRDGTADASHVFVTEPGLRHAPLGIAVFDNRIVLSATPSMIVYTDVDRDAKYDPAIDKREVMLTGFKGGGHDHSLHGVVGAPSGQWHFSFGNCGADVTTKDDRRFVTGSYYYHPEGMDIPSSDGHLYVGGMSLRMNPDGTGLTATGENMRNPHDLFVTAYGDVYQSDNDDPAHSRISWVMEYANMGYADIRRGHRSWEEVAKTWEEPAGWNKSLRFSRSHWRENYPGTTPPGTIFGAGSPTGNLYIEDDTLGLAGTYLVACMVRKEIMVTTPKRAEAEVVMGPHTPFIALKPDEKKQYFLPTDMALGTDGAIYLSDFYNNTSRRNVQASGTIYRITRKDGKPLIQPTIDYTTIDGCIAALDNPAVNVRSHAAATLVESGEDAAEALIASLGKADDPVPIARRLWILAQHPSGHSLVEPFLSHTNINLRITAYRALRYGDPDGLLDRAIQLATNDSAAVRMEVALSLRDVPFAVCKDILPGLIDGYDGRNRWYLEALGTASTGKAGEVYEQLVRPSIIKQGEPASWNTRAKNLAWRLHSASAIADLDSIIRATKPPVDEFRHLAMAFASYDNEEERVDRRDRITAFALLPEFAADYYQLTIKEILDKDLNGLKALPLAADSIIPERFGPETKVSDAKTIAALPGDVAAGKLQVARCTMCHKVGSVGVGFGPDLTHWGKSRSIEEIAQEIVDADAKLAHGYEKPVRLTGSGHTVEGFLTNYSYHAGYLKVKTMGGVTLKVPFRRTRTKIENLKNSWMPSASEMGLTDQNVRDIAEYLQKGIEEKAPSALAALASGGPDDTHGPGWRTLTGEDFTNVNCHTNTWRWEGGHVFCNGKPTGVIRMHQPLKNFEFTCEWMHKQHGGNSGVFVWATPNSIAKLAAGHGSLPHGIEVQVLDLGYAELYKKRYKKPADWFTSHGDVFPVGPVKMTPFPPVAPNGRRSFPTKETTKGINEWNHYFVRAIDGEVRLWVNGEDVSGGNEISPATGYLCLESEGAPIEFKNLRLRDLSPAQPPVIIPAYEPPKPVTLEGHPILGTWHYLDGYTREIRADGFCILRSGDDVLWKRRCTEKAENRLVFEGGLVHLLKDDGKLHIEGRYVAERR